MHGQSGGVEQIVLGLGTAFSRLDDGDEEYRFLTLKGEEGWLSPLLSGPCRLLQTHPQAPSARWRLALALPWLWRAYRYFFWRPTVPVSDGTIESAGIDVMHFTFQSGFRTSIPSIYHPHDLQHLHLPEFFTREQMRSREAVYGPLCRQAAMVAVASDWVRRDVVEHLRIPLEKVKVVPLAPSMEQHLPLATGVQGTLPPRFALPARFVFFPAQTWPHKNHEQLLEALARVREQKGATLPLVCSGRLTEHESAIRARARGLGLTSSLHLLGFVSLDELRALYAAARCVVIPSLFEAASFPLWEAFQSGVPVACSTVTSLPEQAGDAAVLFDPRDVQGMADAVWRVWSDEPLRQRLIERGRERVRRFTWDKTARTFRAHYRRIAGRPLTAEDRALLDAPTGFDSHESRLEPVAPNSDQTRTS